jgi:6-pyruvoyltetrahydropterin/6-carboxytetrahydropterin synthase
MRGGHIGLVAIAIMFHESCGSTAIHNNNLRLSFLESNMRLRGGGYSLGIRDSIMIAHSFKGSEFGPAQGVHGATYTVDVEFFVESLVPRLNWVIDIGSATQMLKEVLQAYNYKDLDKLFKENTTTEFMCKEIFDALKKKLEGSVKGSLTVKLHESHIAWASYHGTLSE